MGINYYLNALRCPLYVVIPSTIVENSLQITPFYAKQTQFYPFFAPKRRFHEKTNPIQTQFKANLTQNKPNLSQYKPNSNPIAKYSKTALWRIMFLLLFLVNIGCGYADKNV